MTNDHELLQFVRQASDAMAAEYARIYARAREDPGTAGDEGEENWAEILRQWLPATYHVATKGRILSSEGVASPQIDVLVLSPSYPRGLLNKKMYLASGVLAGFECKNSLRLNHIRRAVSTGAELRRLTRDDHATDHSILYGLLAHSHAVKAANPEGSIENALSRADAELIHDPRDCLDFICVASLGTWALMRLPTRVADSPESWELLVSYMGPLDEHLRTDRAPNPLGRFLTGLLRRVGPTDAAVASIAEYSIRSEPSAPARDWCVDGHWMTCRRHCETPCTDGPPEIARPPALTGTTFDSDACGAPFGVRARDEVGTDPVRRSDVRRLRR